MTRKILTVGMALVSLFAWGYDVGDYVQDGLVAQYDGIRNVGATLPHNAAARYWVNLASPSNSLGFVGSNVASGSWTNNGYTFTGSSAAQMTNSLALGNAFTIEIVLTADPSANTSTYPNWVDGYEDYGIFTRSDARTTLEWKCDGWTGGSNRPKVANWAGDYLVAVLTATNAYLTAGTTYENAKKVTKSCNHGTARWAFGDGLNTSFSGTRYVIGTYHAMRLYNRPLTEAELARNRAIDEVRFRQTVPEVVVPVGGGKTVTIPTSWFETGKIGERSVFDPAAFAAKFGTDWAVAAVKPTGKTAADGTPMSVWQDYVAGTDPTSPDDVFRAQIEFADGKICIGWTPDLNSNGVERIYTVSGRTALGADDWEAPARPWHRFFKVAVAMPTGAAGEKSAVAGEGFMPEEKPRGGVQLWENGPYWAECNVGATKPEEYGYYFWWGDTVGYKRNASADGWVSVANGTSFLFSSENCPTDNKTKVRLQSAGYIDLTGNLVAAHDAATAHLGAPWRMPTDAEFSALVSNCTTTWITTNGVYGRLVTGKGAYATKSIFLPAAGYGLESGLYVPGSDGWGFFWSSGPDSFSPYDAWYLHFNSSDFSLFIGSSIYRYCGQSVRPVRGPDDIGGDWEPNLLCHLSFDDAGNDGLNVLKVRGGEDAIVRTNPAVVVSGLGAVTVVTDSSILAGLEPGDGAVYIPKKTHLALPIPRQLLDREGHPYTIKMKVRFPGFGPWYSLLNMPASNDSDNMVYLYNSANTYIRMKLLDKAYNHGINGSGGFTANVWETLVIQFGETCTKAFLNGTQIFSYDASLAASFADCFDAGGYFLLSADDDGDDTAMYWADVKVYDGIVDP